jgi:hypothetical protein
MGKSGQLGSQSSRRNVRCNRQQGGRFNDPVTGAQGFRIRIFIIFPQFGRLSVAWRESIADNLSVLLHRNGTFVFVHSRSLAAARETAIRRNTILIDGIDFP